MIMAVKATNKDVYDITDVYHRQSHHHGHTQVNNIHPAIAQKPIHLPVLCFPFERLLHRKGNHICQHEQHDSNHRNKKDETFIMQLRKSFVIESK
jgi:hypothetical protein